MKRGVPQTVEDTLGLNFSLLLQVSSLPPSFKLDNRRKEESVAHCAFTTSFGPLARLEPSLQCKDLSQAYVL